MRMRNQKTKILEGKGLAEPYAGVRLFRQKGAGKPSDGSVFMPRFFGYFLWQ